MHRRTFATTILLPALVGAIVLGAALAPAGAHRQGTPAPGAGPGGEVAAHVHPGATVYHLAAGTLQFTLLEGEARLVRAANGTPAAATPTAAEPVPVDQELALTAGDTVYYDGAAAQAERNDGDAPAVVLVSNLRGADEPAREFVEGTPAS